MSQNVRNQNRHLVCDGLHVFPGFLLSAPGRPHFLDASIQRDFGGNSHQADRLHTVYHRTDRDFISSIPFFAKANVAAINLQELETRLDAAHDMHSSETAVDLSDSFGAIKFEDVMFSYTNAEGRQLFSVGPINEVVHQGEVLFVVGGNGSGKSTFMKLLTGLYAPRSGSIRIDDICLDRDSVASYREMFSIVFSDFFLFERLYGLEDIDPERVNRLLREMDWTKDLFLGRPFHKRKSLNRTKEASCSHRGAVGR